jgi:Protein of unknown function (DUF3567)
MQMLYNSESFVVVRFDVPALAQATPQAAETAPAPIGRGGYEIVDKLAGKEIYIEGAVAESFQQGVQAIVDQQGPSEEALDEFIGRFTTLAQQPVILH